MSRYVYYEIEGDVAIIVLNRPEKHNAFDSKFLEEFGEALNELQRNETIRVLIIRSASSKAFCSGVDLSVLENFKSTSEARQFAILLEETMHKLFSFPFPVIANINGLAFGGGFGIALAADIRLMHEGTVGRFPAVQIGAILPISCTIRLNFFLGVSKSKELLLTGRPISATECLDLNLVHFVGSTEQVDAEILIYIDQFRKANREALILQKIAANQQVMTEVAKYSVQSAENFAYLYASGNWKNITKTLK